MSHRRFRFLIRTPGDAIFLSVTIFFGIILTIALTAASTAYHTYVAFAGKPAGLEWIPGPEEPPPPPTIGKQLSVLIIGTDEHLEFDHGRSDTIIWTLLDFENQKADILSIPRDLLVWLPRKNADFDKIAHAYGYGGSEMVKKSLEGFLGIQIDLVLKVDYDGFRNIVDTLGGVVIDVGQNMDYDDEAGDLHIHISKGRQRLNGKKSLDYVRFRHDRKGDFGRMERQQLFLAAIKDQGLRIENIVKIDDIARIMADSLELSPEMSISEIAYITRFFKGLDGEAITFHSVPIDRDVVFNKLMSLAPNYRKLDEMMAGILVRDMEDSEAADDTQPGDESLPVDGIIPPGESSD